MWTSIYAINQSQVQRYISCKTLGHAKTWVAPQQYIHKRLTPSDADHFPPRSLYVNMLGLCVTVSLAVMSGLTMYSVYKNCDPLSNGDVNTSDQVTAEATVIKLIELNWKIQ